MKRILVATDFSPHAEHALDRAAQLAMQSRSLVDVVHVVTPASVDALCGLLTDPRPFVEEKLAHSALAQLHQHLEQHYPSQAAQLRPHVRVAEVEAGILAAAAEFGSDLIVLGSHGEHFAHELFVGTTAENVIIRSQRPVLVAKTPGRAAYARAGVPVDFSPRSLPAIELACTLAPAANITLLHAFQLPNHDRLRDLGVSEAKIKHTRAAYHDHARAEMDKLVGQCGGGRISPLLEMGYPPAMIQRWTEQLHFDLIVMAKHGERLSSIVRHVLHNSRSDVLVSG